MTHRRNLLATLGAGLLQGCTPLSAFNTLAPRPLGARRTGEGIAYGPAPEQTLDVYRPARPAPGGPVLVFFYGGGWEDGRREDYAFAGRAFASRGFLTVVANYRTRQVAPYPAFLQDCAAAVAWAQQHAADYGADGRRTVLAGHSAGAYNAAMLALDDRWLRDAKAPYPIRAWAGLSGPYDFLPLKPGSALRTFGQEAVPATTQPIGYVSPASPAAFLATGAKDRVVSPRNTAALARRLREAKVRVEERVYPGAGHAELVVALVWPMSLRIPVLREASDFLLEAMGPQR